MEVVSRVTPRGPKTLLLTEDAARESDKPLATACIKYVREKELCHTFVIPKVSPASGLASGFSAAVCVMDGRE